MCVIYGSSQNGSVHSFSPRDQLDENIGEGLQQRETDAPSAGVISPTGFSLVAGWAELESQSFDVALVNSMRAIDLHMYRGNQYKYLAPSHSVAPNLDARYNPTNKKVGKA